jgi:hypothetical protein
MPPIDIKDILNSKVNAPREEANAKDWNFKPAVPPGMSVHIELSRTDANSEIAITADITTQADLEGFMVKCREYVPRKKWLGVF